MNNSKNVMYCILVGGPLDGTTWSEGKECRTITAHGDLQASSETRVGGWHIYKRCEPDVLTREGLIEFHFFTTSESPND